MLKVIKDEEPWYSKGLNFKCTGCGACCTGSPGYVWVLPEEIEEMAAFLGISFDRFCHLYIRKVNGRLSLKEDRKTYDCIFLKDKKCTLYSARPTQCRTYPWWPSLLKSEENWKEEALHCEGIQSNADLVEFDEIQKQLAIQTDYSEKFE